MNEVECRRIVRERANDQCEVCGIGESDSVRHSVHHRRKRSAGGPWTPSNCVLVCGHGTVGCHGRIEANPKWGMRRGLWVSRYGDEATIPVRLWYGCVFLFDDGSWKAVDDD